MEHVRGQGNLVSEFCELRYTITIGILLKIPRIQVCTVAVS